MIDELEQLVKQIKDKNLRSKVSSLLENPTLKIDSPALSFENCPAGSYQHHSYIGGLLQHTIAVTRIAVTLCDIVDEVYGGEVKRDIVIAGCLIHDVYKCYTYEARGDGSFTSSQLGDRIDHLSLVVAELYSRGFPVEVIHAVASHHGENGPIQPKSLEALIVHLADLTDSEFSRRTLRAAEYLQKQAGDPRPRFDSAKEALEIIRLKGEAGWKGLSDYTNSRQVKSKTGKDY